ncbi:MAG: phosphotransferase [Endozoicomonadaceae bacterium]|nr:phosphotransferase [Endozoicomonadaceae bacterium]
MNPLLPYQFVTPAWLTAEFYRCGLLQHGRIIDICHTRLSVPDNASILVRLQLFYSENIQPLLPTQMVMKCRSGYAGMAEIALFRLLNMHSIQCQTVIPVRLCGYDSPGNLSYLLMDDMTDSHVVLISQQEACTMEQAPDDQQLCGIMEALACFHGQCWQQNLLQEAAPILGRGCFWDREQHFATNLALREQEFHAFKQAVQHKFPKPLLDQLAVILQVLPRLWRKTLQGRLQKLQQVTIAHGDCYFRHFFHSTTEGSTPFYLFDFDQATIQTPAYDLVQLLVSYWMPARRQENQREAHLLEHYHGALCDAGVKDYPFERLINDYRLMIIVQLFAAIKEQVRGCGERLWFNRLLCLLGAFEDLDCRQLISRLG